MRPDVTVSMPTQSSVEKELLPLLARRAGVPSTTEVYQRLADAMRLSSKQRALRREDRRLHWQNLVQYAVERLKHDGYLLDTAQSGRGNWTLTDKGRAEAEQLERIKAGQGRGTDLAIDNLL